MSERVASFFEVSADQIVHGSCAVATPEGRYLALDRKGLYWCRAKIGPQESPDVAEAEFVLFEGPDGNLTVLIPLIDGDLRAYLSRDRDGWRLNWHGSAPGAPVQAATLLYEASGDDLYRLLGDSIVQIQARLRSFRLRTEKPQPPLLDGLFWCTWEAFFREVDEQKTLDGLSSLADAGVQVKGMILDDGWLSANGDFLTAFQPNPAKFPSGLESLVRQAKERFGLEWFGIWHAMMGYWAGVDPTSPLGKHYETAQNRANFRPWQEDDSDLSMVVPTDVARFYHDWHSMLRMIGVDMVKIDGQSSLEVFTEGRFGRGSAMAVYQSALQSSAQHWFGGNLIHCMSNGSDVVFNLQSGNVIRTSDDYFNGRATTHGVHLWWNATMSLWSSWIAVSDWDMFWTDHPQGEFHAVARALSGGPIYIGDAPGRHDLAILKRLALPDGRVFRADRPALPTRDCVFHNVSTEPVPLKISNRCGSIGVVGAFHCGFQQPPLSVMVQASDVFDLDLADAVAYCVLADRVDQTAGVSFELESYGCEIVIFSPYVGGWLAPIGLAGMYLPCSAIGETEVLDSDTVLVDVRSGGTFEFVSRRPIASARCANAALVIEQRNDRIRLQVPEAGTIVFRAG
jgi:raffinose synthase